MAIVQISKIIHRTGAITDLPQLDVGELGYATDDQRLFIGDDPLLHPPAQEGDKTLTEVYTDKSKDIPLSKIHGSANTTLSIASDVQTGQILVTNGNVSIGNSITNWTGNLLGPDHQKLKLGPAANIKINGGVNGYFLQTDGLGNLSWTNSVGAVTIAGSPGGSNTQLQFNDAGNFGGSAHLTFDKVSRVFTVDGDLVTNGNVQSSTVGSHQGPIGDITPNSGAFTSLTASTTAIVQGNVTAGNIISHGNVEVTSTVNAANINAANTITADIVKTTHQGNGTNFKVGDDAWIGDINVADTISIRGVEDPTAGYIIFGNSDTTSTLGREGSGPLTYEGSFTANGNIISENANLGNTVTANYFTGTLTTNAQPNVTSLGSLTTLTVTGVTTLGNVANVKITGGSNGFLMGTDGTGNLTWYSNSALLTKPAGSNTQVQFNDSGNFNGVSNFTFNKSSNTLSTVNGVFLGNVYSGGNAVVIGTFGVGSDVTISGNISAQNITVANVQASGIYRGDGSGLTNLPGPNVVGVVPSASAAATALSVINSSQPNITGLGTLTSLSVTGTGAFGNITASGSAVITGNINSGNATLGNLVRANYYRGKFDSSSSVQPNITSVGNLTSLTIQSTSSDIDVLQVVGTTQTLFVSTDTTSISLQSRSNQSGPGVAILDISGAFEGVGILTPNISTPSQSDVTLAVKAGTVTPTTDRETNLGTLNDPLYEEKRWKNLFVGDVDMKGKSDVQMTLMAGTDGLYLRVGSHVYKINMTEVVSGYPTPYGP